jgi:hypothetical protein
VADKDKADSLLNADDALVSESLLDDRVLGKGNSLLLDLTVTSLVDQVSDGGEVGLSVGDVGLDESVHETDSISSNRQLSVFKVRMARM